MTQPVGQTPEPERPRILAPQFDTIPDTLRALDQWVLWRAEWNKERNKWNKIPLRPRDGGAASSTDPSTWGTFAQAKAMYERGQGKYAGVGIVLSDSDPLCGIDLDHALESGETCPVQPLGMDAAAIMQSVPTYWETSPSGTGVRGFAIAALPPGGRKKGDVEMYESGRFLTVTGRRWPGAVAIVDACQSEIEALHRMVWPPQQARERSGATVGTGLDTTDDELLRRAFASKNGAKISALYAGNTAGYSGPSEADLALASYLAFWSGPDEAKLDRLFRGSALIREKWDAVHYGNGDTYGQRTVQLAIANCHEFYKGGTGGGKAEDKAEKAKRREEQSEATLKQDGLPVIECNRRRLRTKTEESIAALAAANDPPTVFVRSGRLARIILNRDQRPSIETLTLPTLRYHLERSANYVSTSDDRGCVPVAPPKDVLEDVLSLPSQNAFPVLEGLVTAPVIAPNGTLAATPGYLPDAKLYYWEPTGIKLPDTTPTPERVKAAVVLLLDTMLGDFPFVDKASRAGALALLLLPFVRPRISGPTPLHLVDASTPGTGKSLLVELVSSVFVPGGASPSACPGREEEEWRKRITTVLMSGGSHVWLDNISTKLDSAPLNIALTAQQWEDRVMGGNANISLPVRCVWAGTGNNVQLSDEMTRRVLWIRLDAEVERPWERDPASFAIADIKGWLRERRADLLGAAVTLLRAWLEAGSPLWDGMPLGSYEDWSRVMGGILQVAGVDGFLSNRQELYERLDPERERWVLFLREWHERHKDKPVGIADVAEIAMQAELMSDEGRGERNRFGRRLRDHVDRVYGGFRLRYVRDVKRAAHYQVIPQSQAGDLFDAGGAVSARGESTNQGESLLTPPEPVYKGGGVKDKENKTAIEQSDTDSSDSLDSPNDDEDEGVIL